MHRFDAKAAVFMGRFPEPARGRLSEPSAPGTNPTPIITRFPGSLRRLKWNVVMSNLRFREAQVKPIGFNKYAAPLGNVVGWKSYPLQLPPTYRRECGALCDRRRRLATN